MTVDDRGKGGCLAYLVSPDDVISGQPLTCWEYGLRHRCCCSSFLGRRCRQPRLPPTTTSRDPMTRTARTQKTTSKSTEMKAQGVPETPWQLKTSSCLSRPHQWLFPKRVWMWLVYSPYLFASLWHPTLLPFENMELLLQKGNSLQKSLVFYHSVDVDSKSYQLWFSILLCQKSYLLLIQLG